MAKYHGKNATVKKDGVAIAEFNNWNIESSLDIVEGQDFGDSWKNGEAGMMSWSGSMDGNFDPANAQQLALINAILSGPTKLTDVVFYIDAAKHISGDIWAWFSVGTDISKLADVTINFQGDGELTYAAT
jgi:hypothetical protein